jgi:hypothetical protein
MNTLLIKRPTRKGGEGEGKGGGSVVMGNGDEKLTFHFSSYDGKISCHGEHSRKNITTRKSTKDDANNNGDPLTSDKVAFSGGLTKNNHVNIFQHAMCC